MWLTKETSWWEVESVRLKPQQSCFFTLSTKMSPSHVTLHMTLVTSTAHLLISLLYCRINLCHALSPGFSIKTLLLVRPKLCNQQQLLRWTLFCAVVPVKASATLKECQCSIGCNIYIYIQGLLKKEKEKKSRGPLKTSQVENNSFQH